MKGGLTNEMANSQPLVLTLVSTFLLVLQSVHSVI